MYCTITTPQSRSGVCFITALRLFCLFFPIDLILICISFMSLLSPAAAKLSSPAAEKQHLRNLFIGFPLESFFGGFFFRLERSLRSMKTRTCFYSLVSSYQGSWKLKLSLP